MTARQRALRIAYWRGCFFALLTFAGFFVLSGLAGAITG